MPVASIPDLVDTLRRCRLLEAPQLRQLTPALQRKYTDPQALAQDLVQRGWLTNFQVDRLMQNREVDLVQGTYVLLDRMGETGPEPVVKARDWQLDRIVALKLSTEGRVIAPIAVLSDARAIAARRRRWALILGSGAMGLGLAAMLVVLFLHGGNQPAGEAADPAQATSVKAPPPTTTIPAAPLEVPTGGPLGPLALVARPATLPGVNSWTIEMAGHTWQVGSMACSPDGHLLATCGDDGAVRLWDPASGQLVRVLIGHRRTHGSSAPLAWSADSKALATCDQDLGEIRLWEAESGRPLRTIQAAPTLYSLAWSPDGKTLACGVDSEVRLYETATGNVVKTLQGHKVYVTALAWSPDGKILASADNTVRLWDAAKGKPLAKSAKGHILHTLKGHSGVVHALAWSPDGKTLASADDFKCIRLWTVAEGEEQSSFWHGARSLAWSPNGKNFVTADGANVQLWAADGDESALHLPAPHAPLTVAHSPDGRKVIGGGSLNSLVAMTVWDAASGRVQQQQEHPGYATAFSAVAWSPDGKKLASATLGQVQLWDVIMGRLLQVLPEEGDVHAVAWSPDGKVLASSGHDRKVRLWDAVTGKVVHTLTGHTDVVNALAWMQHGKTLASGGGDRTVRLWDVASGKYQKELEEQTTPVHGLSCSPDGKWLAASGEDNTVRLWDLATGKLVNLLRQTGAPLAWSPNGKILATAKGERVQLWVAAGGQLLRELPGQNQGIVALAWSDDGVTMQVSCGDGKIQTWDASRGEQLHTSDGPGVGPAPGAFSPDHRTLAGAYLNTLRFCNADTGRAGGALVLLNESEWLAIGPEGHYRSGSKPPRDLVYVVQTAEGQETLSADQFAKEFQWQNDPERARLTDASAPATQSP
jgi:WD40 repeat protein